MKFFISDKFIIIYAILTLGFSILAKEENMLVFIPAIVILMLLIALNINENKKQLNKEHIWFLNHQDFMCSDMKNCKREYMNDYCLSCDKRTDNKNEKKD